MQEQKKYHQRKLAIIEMIEECEKRISSELIFYAQFANAMNEFNSLSNIGRYNKIKNRLLKWLGESNNRN